MLIFAAVFGAVAVLGAAIGLGHVGHPIGGQSVESYGWGLFINSLAITAFFVSRTILAPSSREIKGKPRSARSIRQVQVEGVPGENGSVAALQTGIGRGPWQAGSPVRGRPQATVVLPDDPDAILNALIERVGAAGVDLMLRNRARSADAAA